ncbi:MAG TPA: gamma-glutamylcyclotransferase [Nostocaceae cyanobacterium]|nr:gamma-glutamylcyclotransferase [Nostocaceae cyanobacterium]
MTELNVNQTDLFRVFVYGTLKPGEAYYKRYCAGRVVSAQRAFVFGRLFDLSVGYPGMTLGEDKVKGYLLSFADGSVLTLLDDLEDYSPNRPMSENIYNRQYIEVYKLDGESLGQAWVYVMSWERVQQLGGKLEVDGWWSDRSLQWVD